MHAPRGIPMWSLLLVLSAATPLPAWATEASPPATEQVFSVEQLDQMLAPLALYPDALLAQVLMAATYPGDVADAAAWSKANPKATGDDAVRQVADQPWDPSVQSLVAFPAVLATLGQDPAWVQKVGDAFLAKPDAVMDSVQRLRKQAKDAGNLKSNDKQTVTEQPATSSSASTTQTIIIESADPQVVYVPSYNSTVVYGTWPYPAYPPVYYPPPPGYYFGSALVAGIGFATGVAIVNSLWGDCNWGHGDIDIDVNRYNTLNSNRQLNIQDKSWKHNPEHRDGVPYRDRASREQYGQRLANGESREALRGRDSARATERERARQSLEQRGFEAPASSNRQARERAQSADRALQNREQLRQQANTRTRDNAFAGARQPDRERSYQQRGQASQAAARRPSAARAGGQAVSRPAMSSSRGGGARRR